MAVKQLSWGTMRVTSNNNALFVTVQINFPPTSVVAQGSLSFAGSGNVGISEYVTPKGRVEVPPVSGFGPAPLLYVQENDVTSVTGWLYAFPNQSAAGVVMVTSWG